ncbi:MAG: ribosome recycling factor [Synergistaceae bacterium]|nr:ribosome recycling factor [Synergistota bacterium]NLM70939.1 ribosome recycling factor [Synergistaceae bacterium]
MPKSELKEMKGKMEKVVDHLKNEFLAIRTGRAHPGLVSDIKVDYYGAPTPVKQVATITVPEGRQIAIAPFDRSALKLIEKAILASSLGVTPQSDGEIIRVNLPELTRDRRVELTKLVGKYAEEGRVAIRNIRRDSNDVLKKMEKDSEISEDDLKRLSKEVQDITDELIKMVDEVLKGKEKEIMEE